MNTFTGLQSTPYQRQLKKLTLLPEGIDAVWDRFKSFCISNVSQTRHFMARAGYVCDLDEKVSGWQNRQLIDTAADLRKKFIKGNETAEQFNLAVAIIREASFRRLGMKHYQVQVAAAIALTEGRFVELATGEGKTLVATIPAILAAWRKRACHVMTSNDYLASRDAEEMKPVYDFFGLTVASVTQEDEPDKRQVAYQSDIVYSTNKEVAGDFLRDRIAYAGGKASYSGQIYKAVTGRAVNNSQLTLRGLDFAILDEADSILVDDAVTPLILSGQNNATEDEIERFTLANQYAQSLMIDDDYSIDYKFRDIQFTSKGKSDLTNHILESLETYKSRRLGEELIRNALTANHLFLKDQHYVIEEEKAVIVDESTGRMMPDRTWRHGIHQAVEAKEGIEISPPQITLTQISFQNFFRLYRNLSGMTGTGWEARGELHQTYGIRTVRIPTNRPCIRRQAKSVSCKTREQKYERILQDVLKTHERGQPILLGTRSIDESLRLSELLREEDLSHTVLNALNHAEEAGIVSHAGKLRAITIATNMAGRGTDIKLAKSVRELGGLKVIASEFNDSPRIDRQLYGRAGRQGDPGIAISYYSDEDELLRKYKKNPLMLPLFGLRKPGRGIGMLAVHLSQWLAKRQAVSSRRQIAKNDRWKFDQLGFAGK